MKKRVHVFISGKVQGVCYRIHLQKKAASSKVAAGLETSETAELRRSWKEKTATSKKYLNGVEEVRRLRKSKTWRF